MYRDYKKEVSKRMAAKKAIFGYPEIRRLLKPIKGKFKPIATSQRIANELGIRIVVDRNRLRIKFIGGGG